MSTNGSVLSPFQRDSGCMYELKSTTRCLKMHLNSLWSIWYGVFVTLLNCYIAVECSKRFFDYVDQLKWEESTTNNHQYDLHACIGLTGFSVLLIPFFFSSALFKVGNLANDGFKLGRNLSTCSRDCTRNGTVFGNCNGYQRMWQHCGPAASLFHLIIAFCFLIPKLIIEARSIQSGTLSKEKLWKTDVDFLIPHQGSVISLNFTMLTVPAITTTHNPSDSIFRSLPLSVTTAQDILKSDDTNFGSISIEFLNYALALFVYAVRYPSVFWNTNKYFGVLFSLQLVINSVQCLLMHAGVCILYKVHVIGAKEAIPLLSLRLSRWAMRFGTPFVLNKEVTIALYVMSVVLILVSSLVLYLYGYGRLNSFLNRERARHVITLKDSDTGRTWGYFTHCAALCILVAIGVCEAPLLYDFTLIYRGSLDLLVLVVILSSILHLFIWVLLWLILTLKQHWEFKLRVTVGQATVRSAQSIRLVTDVQLASTYQDYASVPLLVVGHGRTYMIEEANSKKAIMTVIQKNTMEKKQLKANHGNGKASVAVATSSDDGSEQIYWLRPKSRTPRHSPDSSNSETRFGWFSRKKHDKPSVEEIAILPKHDGCHGGRHGVGEDDGDYVRLREIAGVGHQLANVSRGEHSDDTASEDNKLLECVRSDRVTYASVNKDILNPVLREYEDPSPLLTPEPHDHDDLPPPPPELTVDADQPIINHTEHRDLQHCLHRTDSGMPHEEIPSHSDSEVSGGSPPDRCSNSETSSGVHSSSSRESAADPHHRSFELPVAGCGTILHSTYGGDESLKMLQPSPSQQQLQWLQSRNNAIHSPPPPPSSSSYAPHNRVYKPQQHYAMAANKTPVIDEVAEEGGTVVIRRKSSLNLRSPNVFSPPDSPSDRFSRSTNMRMTSFADHGCGGGEQQIGGGGGKSVASTLPHYPTTQPVGIQYQHCSTMPLPVNNNTVVVGTSTQQMCGGGGASTGTSCSSFPRTHTTIPIHHNGIRLCSPAATAAATMGNGGYGRLPTSVVPVTSSSSSSHHGYLTSTVAATVLDTSNGGGCTLKKTSHHTFPQLPLAHSIKYCLQRNGSERDSANFSMGSSGDSDIYCNGGSGGGGGGGGNTVQS